MSFSARNRLTRSHLLTLAILLALFLLTLPAAARATVFQEESPRDASAFSGIGPVYAEGTAGIGKFVWFVDHGVSEDILRGYDQIDPSNSAEIGTINGSVDVGPGPIGTVSGVAFDPTNSKLWVADRSNGRLIIYPRANTGPSGVPVDYLAATGTSNFGGGGGLAFTDPRGLAITSDGLFGFLSATRNDGSNQRLVIKFNPSSLNWITTTHFPLAWVGADGPAAISLDSTTGNLFVVIEGSGTVFSYTPDLTGSVGTFTSPTAGDYNSTSVEPGTNRLFASKSDSIEVFSLKHAKYLGSVTGFNYGSQNAGISTLQNSSRFFLANGGTPSLRNFTANANPTCTPFATMQAVAGSTLTFTPDCTDADSSTIKDFEITVQPSRGPAQTSSGYGAIEYTPDVGELGSDTISYRVTTQNGRSTTYEQSFDVVEPDVEPPVVSITAPVPASTLDTSPTTLSYTVSDNRYPSPECNYEDGAQVSLTEGENTITVSCQDGEGNIGQSSVTFTYVAPDITAPVLEITAPETNSTTGIATTTLQYTVSDDHDPNPVCTLEDGAEIALGEGWNTIAVSCEDSAGNVASASAFVLLDTIAPLVQIDEPTNGTVTPDSSIVVTFDPGGISEGDPGCNIESGDSVPLNPGENTITVTCTDGAGNVGSDSVNVTRDNEAPTVEITSPESWSFTNSASAVINYTVSDDVDASPVCSIEDGATVDLEDGYNSIGVSCDDAAGNTGYASVGIFYDTSLPEIDITAPTDGALTTDSSVTLNYTVSTDTDGEGTFEPECNIEDGTSVDLTPGLNTIAVSCQDPAGNVGTSSVAVTYDAAAPVVSINMPINGATLGTNPTTIHYTVSDDVDASPSCTRANGSEVQLVQGTNTITVSCTDAVGRSGSDSVSVNYIPPPVTQSSTTPAKPLIRKIANLEPAKGQVLIKLPGSDEYIPLSEAVLIPVGTIIDARDGTAHLTLANEDGTTYDAYFWEGIFQVFQGSGDEPIATMKLRDDLVEEVTTSAIKYPRARINPFRSAEIARKSSKRGKKKNGLWGKGKGKFRTSGKGGSATVRGTQWFVADYEKGIYFKVKTGVVNVKPVHGNCFDLKAGQRKFVKYSPLSGELRAKKLKKKQKNGHKKQGCL